VSRELVVRDIKALYMLLQALSLVYLLSEYRNLSKGNPIKPYDLATERFPDFFEVLVEEVVKPLKARIRKIGSPPKPVLKVKESRHG